MWISGLILVCLTIGSECLPANSWSGSTRSLSPPPAKKQKTSGTNIPEFQNAGQVAGVEVWRVEEFKPIPVPKNDYGKFYTGDSYVILNTQINKKGQKTWDIYFWLGAETSQDEAGASAIFAVQLDDQLGGLPVEHREVQGQESQQFKGLFKSGIRYLSGGVASGFRHVDRNAFETKLFQVKGNRNVRVKQVLPSIASMNKGDCFVLDAGQNVYIYVGPKAKRVEKLKAVGAANQLRDQNHSGRARVTTVDEYSPQSDFEDFFKALGSGNRNAVPDESTGGDDQQFESQQERLATLYRVTDSKGRVQATPENRRPLESSQLDPNDCFVLDSGDANIFVWIGKKCTGQEKTQANSKAEELKRNHPQWTKVQKIIQGTEPMEFTQYFKTWQGVGELRPRLV